MQPAHKLFTCHFGTCSRSFDSEGSLRAHKGYCKFNSKSRRFEGKTKAANNDNSEDRDNAATSEIFVAQKGNKKAKRQTTAASANNTPQEQQCQYQGARVKVIIIGAGPSGLMAGRYRHALLSLTRQLHPPTYQSAYRTYHSNPNNPGFLLLITLITLNTLITPRCTR